MQFPSRITFKGGDVEVEEGEEILEEVDTGEEKVDEVDVDIEGIDANVESEKEAEKAEKTDDNW